MKDYEEKVRTYFDQFPEQNLSKGQQEHLWKQIENNLGHPSTPVKKSGFNFPIRFLAGAAALILLAILLIPFFGQSFGTLTTGKTLNDVIQHSHFLSDKKIISTQTVDQGVLIFYKPQSTKPKPYSQLGVQLAKKTIFGTWKLTNERGGYQSSVKKDFYMEAIPSTQSGSPTLLYGEIKNPSIHRIKAADGTKLSHLTQVYTDDQQNDGTFSEQFWFAFTKASPKTNYTVMGLDRNDKPISAMTYNLKTNHAQTTVVFDQYAALNKVIDRHPEFPNQPNKKIILKKAMGGPMGNQLNVDLSTSVSEKQQSTFIVTFTKDWHISVNGTYVKSVYQYLVTPDQVKTLKNQDLDHLINTMK